MLEKRKIEFRGISRKTKKPVFGMLMYSVSDGGLVIVETVDVPPSMSDPCGDTINIYHGIVINSESQFTGNQDSKGNSVYEGDYDSDGNCVVWCKNCNGWEFAQLDMSTKEICIPCHRCDGNFFFGDHIVDFKIIGNVYDLDNKIIKDLNNFSSEKYKKKIPVASLEKENKFIPPPTPPMSRIKNELMYECCPLCGSSYGREGLLNIFQKKHCINPKCKNF